MHRINAGNAIFLDRAQLRLAIIALTCLHLYSYAASPSDAQSIIMYAPNGLTSGANAYVGDLTNHGYSVTVAGPGWNGMTTAEFAAYDLIFIDGDVIGSAGASDVANTQSMWGPVVQTGGNHYLSTADPGFHYQAHFGAQKVLENAVYWGVSGGETGLVIFTGILEQQEGVHLLDNLGPTIGSFNTTENHAEATSLFDINHPAHTIPNALELEDYQWAEFSHGSMTTYGTGYAPLVGLQDGNVGVVVNAAAIPEPPGTFPLALALIATVFVVRSRLRNAKAGTGFLL